MPELLTAHEVGLTKATSALLVNYCAIKVNKSQFLELLTHFPSKIKFISLVHFGAFETFV
jgi:hypothetical protein